MKEDILFFETQRFRNKWLLSIILCVNLFFLYAFVQQVMRGQTFGDKPMSNAGLWIALAASFLITALVLSIRLDTMIKQDGIYLKLFPMHRHYKKYEWLALSKIYTREYHPIGEYGGWGFRIMPGSGKAYNISGNKGIQLVLLKGSKVLIGTKKPGEVSEALSKILKIKNIL